jgi:hypothetical protein
MSPSMMSNDTPPLPNPGSPGGSGTKDASPRPLKFLLSKSDAPTRQNENVASILTGTAVAAEAVKRWATIIAMAIFHMCIVTCSSLDRVVCVSVCKPPTKDSPQKDSERRAQEYSADNGPVKGFLKAPRRVPIGALDEDGRNESHRSGLSH